MTISYSSEVPNGSNFGVFWKILWKWRGSVYKLIWRELIAYLCLYYTINLVYRFALTEPQQRIFEKIKKYSSSQLDSLPLSFVLGFYVSLVVNRWWEQYRLLPWPDTLALFITTAIPNNTGNNETGRLMRRNIMRYMVLAYVITLQRISLRVKRRFPSPQHLVDAGLMLESERKIFEAMDSRSPMSKYWMPLVWATNIINRARRENLISSDHIVQTLLMELSDIRRRLGGLIGYDTVCVPLVYTQVVTLVLYSYFIASLMGRQMLPGQKDTDDLFFPILTVLQFVFYVGWLKVAEVLINPFGEDDDDIELNWLIDRHIKAAYMIVDEMHAEHPELLKDQYWEEVVPKDLPYTVASEHYRRTEPKGSAEKFKVKQSDAMYANIIPNTKRSNMAEEVYADYESVDTPMVERRKNWFSRQITRMGSVRSSSTAYSSGGLFNRNRINSVYSNPEAGIPLPNQTNNNNNHGQGGGGGVGNMDGPPPVRKMSLYDKFVNRKSIRAQRQLLKQSSKFNMNGGSINSVTKGRPRIPTPDVTKETNDKNENRFNLSLTTSSGLPISPVASGVALMTSQLANTPTMYQQASDVPVVGTLLLSPIKEMDSNSTHNTLQAGHPATAALAQAVLPKSLQNAQFGTVATNLSNSNAISTLSFPFAVTSTPDSMPGTLSIVPITSATSPAILKTSTGDLDHLVNQNILNNEYNHSGNSIPITTISLSIPKVESQTSLSDLLSQSAVDQSADNNFLTIVNNNSLTPAALALSHQSVSRKSSASSIKDSYILEKKYSDCVIKENIDDDVSNSNIDSTTSTSLINFNSNNNNNNNNGRHKNDNNGNNNFDNIDNNNKDNNMQQQQQQTNNITTSVPSTLTKRNPQPQKGEVYV